MSSAPKSHGMDGTLTEVDWRPLALEEVRRVLKLFPECGAPLRIVSHSPRPFSAASVVETGTGRVFVKRHHRSVRDIDGLAEEHRFMAHLRTHGIEVPRVQAAVTGATAAAKDEWVYEVHSLPAGVDLYEEVFSWAPFKSVEHARAAGEALAKMHQAAEDFEAPPRKVQPLVASFSIFAQPDPDEGLKHYLNARPVLSADPLTRRNAREALELLAPFHAELKPVLPETAPMWTHNDFHPSNLFWDGSGADAHVMAVVDFGLADRTNVVHDLALAVERSIVEWLALPVKSRGDEALPIHFDHLEALLNGYAAVRPLCEAEAAALAPMTALCHAEFALSEADYFLGVLHSAEKARMADDWYLLGHAHWFRSEHGESLLNFLRRWADQSHARLNKAVTA
jgi:Ser/Thr protein kinase RdoA (MazF antagonist)